MLWFKHDAQTYFRGKLPLIVEEFGAAGYGLYQYVIERIMADVSADNTSFKLHQPVEVVALFMKLDAGLVRQILDGLVKLNLFEKMDGEYYCPQLIDTLDKTMAKSPALRALIDRAEVERDARRSPLSGDVLPEDDGCAAQPPNDADEEPDAEQNECRDSKAVKTDKAPNSTPVPGSSGNLPDPSWKLPGSSGKAPDASLLEKKRKEFNTYCPAGPDGGSDLVTKNRREPEPAIESDPDYELDPNLTDEQRAFHTELKREQARPPEVQMLDLFNQLASRQFKPTQANLKFIRGRLRDFTFAECIRVIEFKVGQWQGTTMDKYLRPETLFNATKFEAYLHESERPVYDMDPDQRGERRLTLGDLEWV